MAMLILPPIPVFNSETNRLEQTTLVQDQNGNLVNQTQIIETKEISSISGASFSLYVDNLSSDVTDGKLSYTISFSMVTSSLSIYYNGLNIIKDVTIQSTNTFVIDSEYEDVIKSGDSLIAIYTVSS